MPSTTRERGLILPTEDVLAVQSGAKTQHRVPVDMCGIDYLGSGGRNGPEWDDPRWWGYEHESGDWYTLEASDEMCSEAIACPFPVGTMLYVRETWSPDRADFYPCYRVVYKADYSIDIEGGKVYSPEKNQWYPFRWRSAATMPKWAARTWAVTTAARVERLQEIRWNVQQLEASGMRLPPTELYPHTNRGSKLTSRFERYWNARYGTGSWDANPFVWAVDFEKVANYRSVNV